MGCALCLTYMETFALLHVSEVLEAGLLLISNIVLLYFLQYWNEARIDQEMGKEAASGLFLQTQKIWTSLL